PPRLHIQRAIDRLMRDMHRLIVGVAQAKPARDLLGRVILAKALLNQAAKLGAELKLCRPRPPRTPPSLTVRGVSAIPAPTAAAVDLTGDRRMRATQAPAIARAEAPRAIPPESSSRSSRP